MDQRMGRQADGVARLYTQTLFARGIIKMKINEKSSRDIVRYGMGIGIIS